MALGSEIIILVLLHQSVIWAHGLTRIWIWMSILPKHAAVHFIIFIISDIIRKYLSRSSSETLIHALITSRLDYCNSLLYGLPKYQLSKLQRVMNASARLVYCAPKSCHITPLLCELHWPPVCYRIKYKIILLTFKVLHGMGPYYLRHLISVLPLSRYNLRRNDDCGTLLTFPKIRNQEDPGG